MWSTRVEELKQGSIWRIAVDRDSSPMAYRDVVQRWQDDDDFRAFFVALLAQSPFASFRWETPPVTSASIGRPFEFVLVDSPGLASKPDPGAFATQFERDDQSDSVIAFHNLGGDAILVVPRLAGPTTAYGHLAAFVRNAPAEQINELWRRVGYEMQNRIGLKAVWLSTAGAGVSWLHVRLDDRPKYYSFDAYRKAPNG